MSEIIMSKTPATLHESHQMEMINPMPSDSHYFRYKDGTHFEDHGIEFTVKNLAKVLKLCPNFREAPIAPSFTRL